MTPVDGEIPEDDDTRAVRIFTQFLDETPSGQFSDRATFEAWRTRWLPYAAGLAGGPTTPEEYAKHLSAMRRTEHG